MYKFVTLYRKVDDGDKLEAFFSETHLPLAEALPDLLKSEVSRVSHKPGGQSRFHLMYELYFADEDTFRRSLISEEGQALFHALIPWSEAKIVTWFYAEAWEEMAQSRLADAGDEGAEG